MVTIMFWLIIVDDIVQTLGPLKRLTLIIFTMPTGLSERLIMAET